MLFATFKIIRGEWGLRTWAGLNETAEALCIQADPPSPEDVGSLGNRNGVRESEGGTTSVLMSGFG